MGEDDGNANKDDRDGDDAGQTNFYFVRWRGRFFNEGVAVINDQRSEWFLRRNPRSEMFVCRWDPRFAPACVVRTCRRNWAQDREERQDGVPRSTPTTIGLHIFEGHAVTILALRIVRFKKGSTTNDAIFKFRVKIMGWHHPKLATRS